MHRKLLIAVLVLQVASKTGAAEIVLRERATPRGSVVRLSDVADLSAAGEELQKLGETSLMPAPTTGLVRFLRAGELRDLLAARGANVRALQFKGASAVAIGSPSAQPAQQANTAVVAGPIVDEALDDSAAETALVTAITEYLRQQTGHPLWQVTVDTDDDVMAIARRGRAALAVSGGKAPWSGRQRFHFAAGVGQPPVVAYARVERMELAAFATRTIERGDFIRRSDVELRPHVGALPAQAITSLEGAVGKEAVQAIKVDSLLATNQVRMPIIVHRGERVKVRARAEGITVRTFGVAQQDGGLGDLVTVESLAGKERYAARVSGVQQLDVFAAGASAGDVASGTSNDSRRN